MRLFILRSLIQSFLVVFGTALAMSTQAAGEKLPREVRGLVPESATLRTGSWAVMPTEFGKTLTGNLSAQFAGMPPSCDSTAGPAEVTMTIKGDTAWEQPPMLDMAIGIYESNIQKERGSLAKSVATQLKNNSGTHSVGDLQDEKLPAGRLLYVEYKEDCARHPKGVGTVLRGYSRKGAMTLQFELGLTKSAAETRAVALEILTRFQKMDLATLVR